MRTLILTIAFVISTLAPAWGQASTPYTAEEARLIAVWSSAATSINSEEAENLAKMSVFFDSYKTSPDQLEPLAEALWGSGNPLGVNETPELTCWDIQKSQILEGPNLLGRTLAWMVPGKGTSFTKEQRIAVIGRWFVRPLVESGVIRITSAKSAKERGFRLDKEQWKGGGKDPAIDDPSAIFTGIGYHPLHFCEYVAGSGKFRSVLPGYELDGLTYEVFQGWILEKGKLLAPEIHKRRYTDFDGVIKWCVTEVIIPAGHGDAKGEFICPTDEEYVAFARQKFGPKFADDSPSTPSADIALVGGGEEDEAEAPSGPALTPAAAAVDAAEPISAETMTGGDTGEVVEQTTTDYLIALGLLLGILLLGWVFFRLLPTRPTDD